MRQSTTLFALCLALAAGATHGATGNKSAEAKPAESKAAQQSRMKTCSAEARAQGVKGDERKKFMSECLKKR